MYDYKVGSVQVYEIQKKKSCQFYYDPMSEYSVWL